MLKSDSEVNSANVEICKKCERPRDVKFNFLTLELALQLFVGFSIFLLGIYCFLEVSQGCVFLHYKARWEFLFAIFNGMFLVAIVSVSLILHMCKYEATVLYYCLLCAISAFTCAFLMVVSSWNLGREIRHQFLEQKKYLKDISFFGLFYQLLLVLICAVAVTTSLYSITFLVEKQTERKIRRRQNRMDRKKEQIGKVRKIFTSNSSDEPAVLDELIHEERFAAKEK